MFNFLRSLFSSTAKYGMGSFPSPADSRNIDIAQVQAPVSIPNEYITDLSVLGVKDQGAQPICVGESISTIAEYYVYKNTGKMFHFDAKALYDQCKREDGIPDLQGTYASVAAKIVMRDGIDQLGIDSNDKFAAGYAFVQPDYEAVCQAIYQNGALSIGMVIDYDWFSGIIGKMLRKAGGHQTILHGYRKDTRVVYGLNSWSVNWIGRVAGLIDDNVKPGHYVARFDDIRNDIMDIIAFAPIPKVIIQDVKNTGYRFLTDMKYGTRSVEVKKLQETLGIIPATGFFGDMTKAAVKRYQTMSGLLADGIVGPAVRAKLNIGTKSYIPMWIEAAKIMERAKKELNNPGNIKCDRVKHKDASGMDNRGICIFPTYEKGYKALSDLFTNACSGKSSRYPSWLTLEQFYGGVTVKGVDYGGYAPNEDNNDSKGYATFVAKRLGVSTATKICDLL